MVSLAFNIKQLKFIDYYIETGNATASAVKAGYSKKTAYSIGQRLLKKVEVQETIKKRMEELDEQLIASAQEVLKRLTHIARGQAKEEVVIVEGTGMGESRAKILSKKVAGKEQVKALELLGKRYGIFDETTVNINNIGITFIDDIKADDDDD